MDLTVLAHLELYHSRPIAPTRRLALGSRLLPTEPAPGAGSVLLGGIAARFGPVIQDDVEDEELELLMAQLERGMRVVQPRLRHRVQGDRVGLLRSHLRLVTRGSAAAFDFSTQGSALVCVLGALYAAGELDPSARTDAFAAIRKGLRWRGPLGGELIGYLSGRDESPAWLAGVVDPIVWALSTLGFDPAAEPDREEIRRRFRQSLRMAHPDHGGAEAAAAHRIAELSEARRILLGGRAGG
jgi:hypothetical protein